MRKMFEVCRDKIRKPSIEMKTKGRPEKLFFIRQISCALAVLGIGGFMHLDWVQASEAGSAVTNQTIQMSYRDQNPLRDALLPVPQSAIFKMDGFYLWDPSVIKVGDSYHLFMSRWPASNGMSGWKKSEVIRAVSKSLFGPYVFAGVVLDPAHHPWAKEGIHNPKVMRVGNRFLLHYLGIPRWQTGFAFADKIAGPWTVVDKAVIPTINASLLLKPDGKVYAVGKFKKIRRRPTIWMLSCGPTKRMI